MLALTSLAAALVATRVAARIAGLWLWNLDLPKIDYPLAVFFSEALRRGELPLWNDRLGLGFPLYAEGQIGAFYPPSWAIFLLDPLVALDVTRVAHLVVAGVGTGLLALRLSGSRPGAVVAAATAVLSGAIVAKLEWTNLVIAYAWAPWVLLGLMRRPAPTWPGLATSAVLWGVQALAGHPNTWALTGLAAAAVLVASAPRALTALRLALFALVGVGVGAVQLVPSVLLASLSVRSEGVSRDDLFSGATTPFDGLLFAFANAFVRIDEKGWDLHSGWYPDGSFGLLEATAYVGLPILVLAAIGWRVRRGRPLRALVLVLIAVPVLAAFRPEVWTQVPLLNGLRAPTRAYLFVDLGLALLASMALARIGRDARAPRTARTVIAVAVAAYAAVLFVALALPATFEGLLLDSSARVNLSPAEAPAKRALAVAALTRPVPLLLELAIALSFAALVWVATRRRRRRPAWPLAAVAVLPLVLLSPLANPLRPVGDFTFGGNDLHSTLLALAPHRVLTIGAPGWYPGMPDQLAAAGVPDVAMFSSLNLAATDALLERLRHDADAARLRQLAGIDTVVTFKTDCPGEPRARATSDDAQVCSVPALTSPYWIPRAAATLGSEAAVPWRPTEASIDAELALLSAAAVRVERRSATELRLVVEAPADGWVFIDRAWWPAWLTWVDGQARTPARALAAQLIAVTSGVHVIEQRLLPLEAGAGLVLGAAVLAVAIGAPRAWRRARRA